MVSLARGDVVAKVNRLVGAFQDMDWVEENDAGRLAALGAAVKRQAVALESLQPAAVEAGWQARVEEGLAQVRDLQRALAEIQGNLWPGWDAEGAPGVSGEDSRVDQLDRWLFDLGQRLESLEAAHWATPTNQQVALSRSERGLESISRIIMNPGASNEIQTHSGGSGEVSGYGGEGRDEDERRQSNDQPPPLSGQPSD